MKFQAKPHPSGIPCAQCGTPCGINEFGDAVCIGDANCFLLNMNDAICTHCDRPYHAHGFGMGNEDPRVGECITGPAIAARALGWNTPAEDDRVFEAMKEAYRE